MLNHICEPICQSWFASCRSRPALQGGSGAPLTLFAWRKAARAGLLTLPADEAPMFVPVVRETHGDGAAVANGSGAITIEIAGAVVRAPRGVDPGWLRDVLRAVKAAT